MPFVVFDTSVWSVYTIMDPELLYFQPDLLLCNAIVIKICPFILFCYHYGGKIGLSTLSSLS